MGAQRKSSQLDFYAILLQNYCFVAQNECSFNALFDTNDYRHGLQGLRVIPLSEMVSKHLIYRVKVIWCANETHLT